MQTLIAGDYFVSDTLKNTDLLDKSIIDEFEKAYLRVVNQEVPITKNIVANKMAKTGQHLQSIYEAVVRYLK